MTRDELIEFCLTFPLAYEDYPFDKIADDNAWAVIRHKTNKKSFALIYNRNGNLCVNLKCEPLEADFFRQVYTDVTPAYHMNKQHWNTVVIGGDVPDQELFGMVRRSYELIKPGVRANKRLVAEKDKLWPNNLYRLVFGEDFKNVPDNAEEAIEYVLKMLRARESAIVLARLRDYKTYSAIGEDYSITGNRVMQIHNKAIRIMRHPSRSRFLINLAGQLKHDLEAEETAKEIRSQDINGSEAEKLAAMKEIQVSDLNLSPRCYNCLTRIGITTLADLAGTTLEDLSQIRNFGGKCIREVLVVCEKYGVVIG